MMKKARNQTETKKISLRFWISGVLLLTLLCLLIPMSAFAAPSGYAVQTSVGLYEADAAGAKLQDAQIVAPQSVVYLWIDSDVSALANNAFAGATSLQQVYFGSATGLRSLGAGAFSGCTALTSVDLSKTALTDISSSAFLGCTNLKSVTFPANLQTIGVEAFSNCTSLQIGESLKFTALKNIEANAFQGCTSITWIYMPSSFAAFSSYAFHGCSSLSAVGLQSSLPPMATTTTFSSCNPSIALQVDPNLVATYKAAADGDSSDIYWYSCLVAKENVSSSLTLTASNFAYGTQSVPPTTLKVNGTATTTNVTYTYATSKDGTYGTRDSLPRGASGALKVGTYWVKATYQSTTQEGTAKASFSVTQQELTAELFVLGIEKVYDGTDEVIGLQPTVYLHGAADGDAISGTGEFAYESPNASDAAVICGTKLVLEGADKDNYILTNDEAQTKGAVITKQTVKIASTATAERVQGGESLGECVLSGGEVSSADGTVVAGHWEWKDASVVPTETAEHKIVFVPDDATNYASVEKSISVEVVPAPIAPTATPDVSSNSEDDASSESATQTGANANDGQTNEKLAPFLLTIGLFCSFLLLILLILWLLFRKKGKRSTKNDTKTKTNTTTKKMFAKKMFAKKPKATAKNMPDQPAKMTPKELLELSKKKPQ